jgi:hypothetical protein
MNETIQAERYSTARPLDQFAHDFLNFLVTRKGMTLLAPDAIVLGPPPDGNTGDNDCMRGVQVTGARARVKRVKVLRCGKAAWSSLWFGLGQYAGRHGDNPEFDAQWLAANNTYERWTSDGYGGLSFLPSIYLPAGSTMEEGPRYYLTPELRSKRLTAALSFTDGVAKQLSAYDALILMPDSVWKGAGSKNWLLETQPQRVCAHECLHIALNMAREQMPRWDRNRPETEPSTKHFNEYVRSMSPTVPGLAFKARYLDRGEPQADRIDL